MEAKSVSLVELRDFLLSLPDNTSINMTTGSLEGKDVCLMSLYGKDKGFDFDYSSATKGWLKNGKVVVKIESSIISLFSGIASAVSDKKATKVKWWKDRIASKYNPNLTFESLLGD